MIADFDVSFVERALYYYYYSCFWMYSVVDTFALAFGRAVVVLVQQYVRVI